MVDMHAGKKLGWVALGYRTEEMDHLVLCHLV